MKTIDRICVAVGAGVAAYAIAACPFFVHQANNAAIGKNAELGTHVQHAAEVVWAIVGVGCAVVAWGLTGLVRPRSPS